MPDIFLSRLQSQLPPFLADPVVLALLFLPDFSVLWVSLFVDKDYCSTITPDVSSNKILYTHIVLMSGTVGKLVLCFFLLPPVLTNSTAVNLSPTPPQRTEVAVTNTNEDLTRVEPILPALPVEREERGERGEREQERVPRHRTSSLLFNVKTCLEPSNGSDELSSPNTSTNL
jgi:hypothetical protein